MSLIAVSFPIVPGKTDAWRAWLAEIQPGGARRADFISSRKSAGVRERTFLQQTPMGDFVVVTLEGNDAESAFSRIMGVESEFNRWFVEHASSLHGIDLGHLPAGAPSQLVVDTEG